MISGGTERNYRDKMGLWDLNESLDETFTAFIDRGVFRT